MADACADWKNKHAALGVALSSQLNELSNELASKAAALVEAEHKVVELEAEGGKKAKAENQVLSREIEELKAQLDVSA